jgi:hypothetical protein
VTHPHQPLGGSKTYPLSVMAQGIVFEIIGHDSPVQVTKGGTALFTSIALMPVTAFSVLDHLIALALTAMDVHDHIMLDVSVKINTYLAIPYFYH